MKSGSIIRAIANVAMMALVGLFFIPTSAAGLPTAGTPVWSRVTIPGLAVGTQATFLWTDAPGSVYVWADGVVAGTTSVPEATLFHWFRGVWNTELNLPGFSSSAVYGTGPADVFAAAIGCSRSTQSECAPAADSVMYHFNGSAWAKQTLPAGVAGGSIGQISGFPGAVQAAVIGSNQIIGYDGTSWSVRWGPTVQGQVAPQQLTLVAPDEGYYVGCIGYGWWDGAAWSQSPSYTFCDVYDVWGFRDSGGVAHVYAVGNNGFSNGIRVWRGDERPTAPPLSFDQVFGAGSEGSAYGVWGSGPADIYVVGRHGSQAADGAIFHFDGAVWSPVESGAIPTARDVWGSGKDDVWVSLTDGSLMHYGLAYQFGGFFAPVQNPPALNKANAGRTVPVKFSLQGERSTDVLAPGYPVSRQVSCDGTQPGDAVPTESPGGRGLAYSPEYGRFEYGWKTDRAWAGSCREFILRLDDGSQHSAMFSFT